MTSFIIRYFSCKAAIILSVTFLALSACHDAPTSVRQWLLSPALPSFQKQTIVGTANIPISPYNHPNGGQVANHHTGIMLQPNTWVIIRVTGPVNLSLNPDYSCCLPGGLPVASVGPGGYNNQLKVQDAKTYGTIPGSASFTTTYGSFHQDGTNSNVWETDPIYVGSSAYHGGELLISRTGIGTAASCTSSPTPPDPGLCTCPPDSHLCAQNVSPQFLMSGTQTVTVIKVERYLTLNANPLSGGASLSTAFTLVDNSGQSVSASQWWWVADLGTGTTAPCGGGQSGCTTNVNESGTMYAKAWINGKWEVASRYVEIINCVTGDSLLDHKAVRDTLLHIWGQSNSTAPNVFNRQERVAVILEGPDEKLYALTIPTIPVTNNCYSTWQPLSALPGQPKVRAYVHTHPHYSMEPYQCPGGPTFSAMPGGSPSRDWPALKHLNRNNGPYDQAGWVPVPFYVMDRDHIWKLNHNESAGDELKPQNTKLWSNPTCHW